MSQKTEKRIDPSLADWPYRNVFLTGGTGLIGGQILLELLEIPQIETITCLVRPAKGKDGVKRLSQRLKKVGLRDTRLTDAMSRVRAAEGEISEQLWGMSDSDLAELRNQADLLIHCAASTSFVDVGSCEAANVAGKLMAFACRQWADPKITEMVGAELGWDQQRAARFAETLHSSGGRR